MNTLIMPSECVGQRIARVDSIEKVKGKAIYIDDLKLPNMLYGKVLRSPLPHARIISIDTSRAEKLPGVKAVITSEDLPDARYGTFIQDVPILARSKVRYIGEPVAAVAAIDKATANEALNLINVKYKELTPVFTTDFALDPKAPLIHEEYKSYKKPVNVTQDGNICNHTIVKQGDLKDAFKDADFVFEDSFTTQTQSQVPLEICGAVAQVDSTGNVTVWSPNQGCHNTQMHVSQGLLIPYNKIRSIKTIVGGAFGGRIEAKAQPLTVALAQKSGYPVKLIYTREEDFITTTPRHPANITIKSGINKDGKILARQVRVIFDAGAYADQGPGVAGYSAFFCLGPYKIPVYQTETLAVYTNNIVRGAFRGFGNPQVTFATESHMDMIAERIDIDPIEFRLINAVEKGDVSLNGLTMHSVAFKETLQQAVKEANWGKKLGKGRGLGIGCYFHESACLSSSAFIKLNNDGTVTVLVTTGEMGQGSETVLTQIVSEDLGIPIDMVTIVSDDTDVTPFSSASAGSRTTFTTGNALLKATADLKEQMIKLAAEQIKKNVDSLDYKDGKIISKNNGRELYTLEQISKIAIWGTSGPIIGRGSYLPERPALDPEKISGATSNPNGFIFGTQIAEVEVDEITGQVKVIKVISAHDAGRVINPMLTEGQIEGGIVQGLGYALSEELLCKEGRVLNGNLLDYKIPSAMDIPEMKTILVDEYDCMGPFGAKGVGESPLVGIAPAIANAVKNATGLRITQLPLNMENVWRSFKETNIKK